MTLLLIFFVGSRQDANINRIGHHQCHPTPLSLSTSCQYLPKLELKTTSTYVTRRKNVPTPTTVARAIASFLQTIFKSISLMTSTAFARKLHKLLIELQILSRYLFLLKSSFLAERVVIRKFDTNLMVIEK